jgi:hypothetical protein
VAWVPETSLSSGRAALSVAFRALEWAKIVSAGLATHGPGGRVGGALCRCVQKIGSTAPKRQHWHRAVWKLFDILGVVIAVTDECRPRPPGILT